MPKTYEVIISEEAERNIEAAFHWIAKENPIAAKQWYEGCSYPCVA